MKNGNVIHAQVSVKPWLTTATFGTTSSTTKTHIFGNLSSKKDLRLGLKRLDNDEDRQVVQTKLLGKTNDELELDILKAYIDAEEEYGDTEENIAYQALARKYEALTAVPSTIEKTMTPAQLYVSDSSIWALNYDPDMIKQMLNHLRNYPKSEEIFNIVLAEVSGGIARINKFGATL